MPCLEYVAKNVGIRRAGTEWVLCTNVDSLLSPQMASRLVTAKLDPGIFYRANRTNLGSDGIPIRFIKADEGAAGDFMMMRFKSWVTCCGYPEFVGDDTIDSLMVELAKHYGLKQVVWPEPVYHQYHEPGRAGWPSLASRYKELLHKHNEYDQWGLETHDLQTRRTYSHAA